MAQSTDVPLPQGAAWRPRILALAAQAAGSRWISWLPLVAIAMLAFVLNAWGLSQAGYGNTYYAAAVRSMTMSGKNFFFASFDPGGYITVDKPPFFLWVDALSARIFGYSSWSLLLPSALAGAATVVLLWLIVRRHFGTIAATISGLALAISPISVAVNRLNLPEPFLILALVGAAGAVLQSIESRRWWAWLALAGFLVGVAFNTKMLAGWIPGPAFALAVVAGTAVVTRISLRSLLARLAVLAAVTFIVSGSWMMIVDAWPASDRPYVGGSKDNTELNLALDYNGFGRVDGNGQGVGGGGARPTFNAGQGPGGAAPGANNTGSPITPNGGPAPGAAPPAANAARTGFRGPGGILGGAPDMFRMFDAANGGQIGWLLPFALGAGVLSIWVWRRDPLRRTFGVLFVGWVLLYGGVFSYAGGIYHSYYTSAMAPGVAALVGVGSITLLGAIKRDRRWLIALVALVGLTVWAQLQIAGRTPDFYGWVRPITVATAFSGLALAVFLAARRMPVATGLMLSVGGLLLLPAAWSFSTTANTSLNNTLPQAGPQRGAAGGTFGSEAFNDGTGDIAAWLHFHGDANATWDLVVPNAMSGSRLIAQYELSVMALGGFLGSDNAITVGRFADLVAEGKVRYVLTTQAGPGGGGFAGVAGGLANGRNLPNGEAANPYARFQADGRGTQPGVPGGAGFPFSGPVGFGSGTSAANAVISAVRLACTPVSDSSLPAQYQGSLYDCVGKAAALHAQETR
ncbi:MAG TPA: glycosyltransferase family 39 protein [Dehalococcoidia bacterium]|nr:glycosyltransferase family 39 protein [Dehalococcoidia bacterium]